MYPPRFCTRCRRMIRMSDDPNSSNPMTAPPPTICKRFSGADALSALSGGTFQHMGGLPEHSGLPSPMGPQLWPLAFTAGNPPMLPAQPFQQLTTCSWEQNDTIVKVYVPLRGIQTDMLRPVFTPNSAEVGDHAARHVC